MNVVVFLLVLFVLTLASACTTETKAGDAGDAAGNAALVDASVPTVDSDALASGDAGADASAPMDAGAPLDAAQVADAGSELGATTSPTGDGTSDAPERPASGKATAFDRVLGCVPGKGQVLNRLAWWWFDELGDIVANHALSLPDPNVLVARRASLLSPLLRS